MGILRLMQIRMVVDGMHMNNLIQIQCMELMCHAYAMTFALDNFTLKLFCLNRNELTGKK